MNAVLNQGRTGRDAGMTRATAHADHCNVGWSDRAYLKARKFLRRIERTFTAEQIRAWAYRNGLEEPTDDRAWGSILTRLSREGHIRKVNYTQAEGRACHMHPVTLWKVVE